MHKAGSRVTLRELLHTHTPIAHWTLSSLMYSCPDLTFCHDSDCVKMYFDCTYSRIERLLQIVSFMHGGAS